MRNKTRGMLVIFIVAVQQVEVPISLDVKALVCSQGEMLVNQVMGAR